MNLQESDLPAEQPSACGAKPASCPPGALSTRGCPPGSRPSCRNNQLLPSLAILKVVCQSIFLYFSFSFPNGILF